MTRRRRDAMLLQAGDFVHEALRGHETPPGISHDDVFQSTVVRIASHIEQYDPKRSTLRTFAWQHAKWALRQVWRDYSPKMDAPPDETQEDRQSQAACDSELEDGLRKVLSREEFAVISCVVMRGQSLPTVARTLGLSAWCARRVKREAMAKLRASLAPFPAGVVRHLRSTLR